MNHKKYNGIGTLRESSLHAVLKQIYSNDGDIIEAEVGNFVVDVFDGTRIIEIQTSSFSSIKKKLSKLISKYEVKLVYPLANEKWIIHESIDGSKILSRRKSPKRMSYLNVFEELVSMPRLVAHSNFSLEVILVKEEEVRRKDGKGSWRRRGWSIIDHRLLKIVSKRVFKNPSDFVYFIPQALIEPFTTSDFAESVGCSRRIAQKAMYCMRKMGYLSVVGKKGKAFLHARED
jgi:hypothetical protein